MRETKKWKLKQEYFEEKEEKFGKDTFKGGLAEMLGMSVSSIYRRYNDGFERAEVEYLAREMQEDPTVMFENYTKRESVVW
jgi:hypothetical protein